MSRIAALTLVGLAVAGAPQARESTGDFTEPWLDYAPPHASVVQLPNRRSVTLAEAIAIAQRRQPGRVVRSQTLQLGNGAVHEIRIIGNDGGVHTIRVDASTGAVQSRPGGGI